MKGYLGSFPVTDLSGTPFEGFGPSQWALAYIEKYGQIDGSHHKLWVLDQIARILHGTPVMVSMARWENEHGGHFEYRFTTDEPSAAYLEWAKEMEGGHNFADSYDMGVAP